MLYKYTIIKSCVRYMHYKIHTRKFILLLQHVRIYIYRNQMVTIVWVNLSEQGFYVVGTNILTGMIIYT